MGERSGLRRTGGVHRSVTAFAVAALVLWASWATDATSEAVAARDITPGVPVGLQTDSLRLVALEEAVDSLRGGPPAALGEALLELAEAYASQARHEMAVDLGREAIGLLESAADSANLALAHHRVGLSHWNLVQYDSAVVQLTRAQGLWTALDDRLSLGRVANNLGAAHYQWGNYELALSAFLQALQFRRETGSEAGQAIALTNVGLTYRDWGLYDRALEAYEEAIQIADRVEYAFGQAYSRLNMAELHLSEDRLDPAEELFRASLALYESEASGIVPSDALGGRILNLLGLASVETRRGDPDAGIRELLRALDLADQVDNPRYVARIRLELGQAHAAAGRYDDAFDQLEVGLAVARDGDQRPIALEILAALAEVEEMRGVPDRALAHLQAHVALRDSLFDQGAVQRIAAMEAQTEADRQQRENALLREEQRVREAVIERQRVITLLAAGLLLSAIVLTGVLVYFNWRGRARERTLGRINRSLEDANRELLEAQVEVQTLKGLIPICSRCKRVRDDEGYWETVESYITQRSEAFFSHSICTDCGPGLYGEDWKVPSDGRGSE